MKKTLFVAALLFILASFVVAISSVGEARGRCLGINGSVWSGFESQQGSEPSGWIGGEVYFPGILCSNNLALELHSDVNFYGVTDLSAIFGLRGIFPYCSLGTGAGFNFYDVKNPRKYDKWYGWASGYCPCFFSRIYFDITQNWNYGQFSAVIDLRTKPFGVATSYLYSLKPGGEYEELRGDISLSLCYPGNVCYESDYDFDFRVYLGGRIASFFNPVNLYRADWKSVLGGLRLITPGGNLRFEVQVAEKNDRYVQGNHEGKLVISGSCSF
jgi:hypothetical protein